eukprot:TRINITY_DN927_c0_g1_i2.p1 TRINITY_DN927_c0_g1~~TRINITY_DN927_c0_g1_i2.p1  ORF type:complete len:149 (-),score=50.99 TRINITY_DN927_c0_g1_i2:60-506(-)
MSVSATEVKACFESFDIGGHGYINKKQLASGIRALGYNPTNQEIDDACEDIPDNVDFGSFSALYNRNNFQTPEQQDREARSIFKVLDAENDGTIAESELRQMLATVGDTMSHYEIDLVMSGVEVSIDGRVNYEDFVTHLVTGFDELIN